MSSGSYGIFTSLVFAAWFFIAVEELPLAGEDAINPTQNIPRALIGSITILMITAFLTAFFSVSVPGGIDLFFFLLKLWNLTGIMILCLFQGSFNISQTGAPLSRALIAGLMDECVNLNDPLSGSAQDFCEDNLNGYDCTYNEEEGTCWDTSLSTRAKAWEIVINFGTLIGLMTSCHAIIFAGGISVCLCVY